MLIDLTLNPSESDTGYQTAESPFGEKEQTNQSEKRRGQNLSQSEEAEFRQKFRQIVFNPNPRKSSLFETPQELFLIGQSVTQSDWWKMNQ